MKDRKIYAEFSSARKSGDSKAAREAIEKLNAKTTRKHEARKSGRLTFGGGK